MKVLSTLLFLLLAAGCSSSIDGPETEERTQASGVDSWEELATLIPSEPEAGDELGEEFGVSVAIDGDISVVGEPDYVEFGSTTGAVYIFERDEVDIENWEKVARLLPSDGEDGDEFGASVDVYDDVILVGAPRRDASNTDVGAAYIFQRDQGGADNWGEVAKVVPSDYSHGDAFGRAVALKQDRAAIGAPHYNWSSGNS